MDLKTFVADTLTQIAEGIKEAQKNAGNVYRISPRHVPVEGAKDTSHLEFNGDRLERVDFDVALTTSSEASGDIGSKLVVLKATATGKLESESVSRVSFSVYVQWPRHGEYEADAGGTADNGQKLTPFLL